MKISIIIPCFNEEKFIIETLKKVNKQRENFDIQIIVSDDCSTDKTIDLLNKNTNLYDDIIISERNKGKGSAIKYYTINKRRYNFNSRRRLRV